MEEKIVPAGENVHGDAVTAAESAAAESADICNTGDATNEVRDAECADIGNASAPPASADADADADAGGTALPPPCCSARTTARTEEDRRRLVNRLARLEGQIRGIRGMVEKDAYCNDILIQSTAVAAAIDAFNRELFSAHVKSCVVRDLRSGDAKKAAAVTDEMTDMIRRLTK